MNYEKSGFIFRYIKYKSKVVELICLKSKEKGKKRVIRDLRLVAAIISFLISIILVKLIGLQINKLNILLVIFFVILSTYFLSWPYVKALNKSNGGYVKYQIEDI